jgi:hypothetical protein
MFRISPTAKHIGILLSTISLITAILLLLRGCQSDPRPEEYEIVSRARLLHLQSSFDEKKTFDEVGLKPGNPPWAEYRTGLEEVYQRYFAPKTSVTSNATRAIENMRDRVRDTLSFSASTHGSSLPRTIHTTSKSPNFPPKFASWKEMNQEDGWKFQHYDDEGILDWIKEAFNPDEGFEVLDEYEKLPSGVLRG